MEKGLARKMLAEVIGTAVLVAMGCGTAVAMGCDGTVSNGAYLGTALAFGLSVVAMAYAVGPISGCHLNPAISLACAIDGRMSWSECAYYVLAQCSGAFLGCFPIVLANGTSTGYGANALAAGASPMLLSILIELFLTFVFVFVVLGVTDAKNGDARRAGIVIGLTLTLVHLVGIRYTGTSVNPARSLAPAILAGGSYAMALPAFIIGPLAGGALAALAYRYLADEGEEDDAQAAGEVSVTEVEEAVEAVLKAEEQAEIEAEAEAVAETGDATDEKDDATDVA